MHFVPHCFFLCYWVRLCRAWFQTSQIIEFNSEWWYLCSLFICSLLTLHPLLPPWHGFKEKKILCRHFKFHIECTAMIPADKDLGDSLHVYLVNNRVLEKDKKPGRNRQHFHFEKFIVFICNYRSRISCSDAWVMPKYPMCLGRTSPSSTYST